MISYHRLLLKTDVEPRFKISCASSPRTLILLLCRCILSSSSCLLHLFHRREDGTVLLAVATRVAHRHDVRAVPHQIVLTGHLPPSRVARRRPRKATATAVGLHEQHSLRQCDRTPCRWSCRCRRCTHAAARCPT